MENTRNKPKKTKIQIKPKSKSNPDEIDDQEAQLLSPVERVKINHLATTPITPAGNIVDMQGSLNQATPDKLDDDKSDGKTSASKSETSKDDNNKDSPNVESSLKESSLPEESDVSKSDGENKVIPDGSKEPQSPSTEDKQSEGQTETDQLHKISSPVSDSSIKQSVPENQGKTASSSDAVKFIIKQILIRPFFSKDFI